MMTSGIVVLFDPAKPAPAATLAAIGSAPAFTIGEQRITAVRGPGNPRRRRERALARLAAALAGVVGVEVVFVHWDDSRWEVTHAGA